jgi:hypothetical protein
MECGTYNTAYGRAMRGVTKLYQNSGLRLRPVSAAQWRLAVYPGETAAVNKGVTAVGRPAAREGGRRSEDKLETCKSTRRRSRRSALACIAL